MESPQTQVASDDAPLILDEACAAGAASALLAHLPPLPAGRRRIAVLAGNEMAFIAARDAATAAGAMLVPINPKLAPPEIAYIVADADAPVLLASPALAAQARAAITGLSPAPRLLVVDERITDAPPRAPAAPAYGATLIYTSGTTGRPKGCVRTAEQEAARGAELIATYGLGAGDVHLIASPLAHSAPGIFLRACRQVGARTVILPRFRPEAFLAAVVAHGATFFFLVPTQFERLLALPAATRASHDTSSVRAALVAGAPIAPGTKARIVRWLGEGVLWEFYGSSETGTVAVLPPGEQLTRPRSVGKPPPGVSVRLHDVEDGVGEIYVSSPAVMSGYRGAPASLRDGHLSVGDLGYFDDDGYLHLVDRKHDTIISGGVNVYPAEVERAIGEHPSVTGAVVFGMPDDDWGEIVSAVVATSPTSDITATELRAFLRTRIAPFKLPKAMAFIGIDELPIGSSGKPLRRIARERLAERLERVDV